jgi:predicted acetyltransferase
MDIEVRPCASDEEVGTALNVIGHYFGHEYGAEDGARFSQWIEQERMFAAYDGDLCVGGAGALTYRMSVPGGDAPTAGVTVVGVLPTHRRRGVLTTMIRTLLDDARDRGEPLAYLWASEATIYGRFGFGLASMVGEMTLSRDRVRFAVPFEQRGVVRLVGEEESVRLFTPLYEQMYAQRPGGRRDVSTTTRSAAAAAGRCTVRCSSSTASRPAMRSTRSSRAGRAAARAAS